jgi:hypothetical protein
LLSYFLKNIIACHKTVFKEGGFMSYIIENANVLNEQKITKTHFLIKQDRIASYLSSSKRFIHMKMDAEPFIMTPAYVFFDPNLPEDKPFEEMKTYFLEHFIKKGCTTLLTTAEINFESEFPLKMKRKQSSLNTSPIDYIIAAKIPVRLLTPTLIRKCKKEKTPAIFVRIEHPNELENVPWGWIRESLFPYNCPLIPVIDTNVPKMKQKLIDTWCKITVNEKIPSLTTELPMNQPIIKQSLAKVGIYPQKGSIIQGGEVSYNLYLPDPENKQVEEFEWFHYHSHRLVVTMHKGKIIRAGNHARFRSGYGERVNVKIPSLYTL